MSYNWLSAKGCLAGAFLSPPWQGIQHHPTEKEIETFEQKIGKKLAIVMTFQAWGVPERLAHFPEAWCTMVNARGSLAMITWEPWDQRVECRDYLLARILQGEWDFYLKQWAVAIQRWGKPILIRWGHEMNGTWYPWDGLHNDRDPSRYVEAFRHVVNLFREQKVTNVYWVWSPEVALDLFQEGGVHDYTRYYPGDEYVDWIGLDGYNLGAVPGRNDPWRSFDEIFGQAYQRLARIAPKKPLMIAEFGCGEGGGSKPQWIEQAFVSIRHYPNLKAWLWFNIQKEANWPVDSSPEALASFRQAIDDPYFLSWRLG